MPNDRVVVVGGTQGLGRELAQAYARDGREVVVTGRDQSRADRAAGEIGGRTRGIGFDLAQPHAIADRLAELDAVQYLVLAAIERDVNKVSEYDVDAALRLVTLKLVGYTEVIHTLSARMLDDSAILIFGGLARDRPYPGSTTVTTVMHQLLPTLLSTNSVPSVRKIARCRPRPLHRMCRGRAAGDESAGGARGPRDHRLWRRRNDAVLPASRPDLCRGS